MYTIIGGGIGGLTTALAFEKLNIEYQLFERAPALNEVGAGIWLAPNALQVMEWLGTLEAIQESGNVIDRITLARSNLSPLSDTDQDIMKDKFGYSTVAIHRAELQRILFDRVPKHKIVLGKAFEKYEYSKHPNIKLLFSDGTSVETPFLIGADGIHSKIRKQLFPGSKIRFSGQTCWRGIADSTLESDFIHRGMELWGKRIRFGISQVSEKQVYWFAVATSEANGIDNPHTKKQHLLSLFADFHPLVSNLIYHTPTSKIIRNDIWDLQPMLNWYKDNICLLGDAGHATTPNMGQGAAQAIEDAYYLAHSIKAAKDNGSAFKIFQKRRFKKVNNIVNQSWRIGQMAHWKFGRGLRNLMIRSIPAVFTKRKMIELYQIEKW